MADKDLVYEEEFKIRASEVNINQQATLPAICNLLQEIAGNHARELQFDITDLQINHLTWVLHRLRVQIDRPPLWRETIKIQTWPSGSDGLRAYRDFLISDSEDNIIGKSLSYWVILDMESRRPTPIPNEILEYAPKKSDHVLPLADGGFTEVKQADSSQSFEVRKTDLDLNRHVNNVRYIEWALSCLADHYKTDNIDIKFLDEAVKGDTITASSKTTGTSEIRFQLIKEDDQKTLALASIR